MYSRGWRTKYPDFNTTLHQQRATLQRTAARQVDNWPMQLLLDDREIGLQQLQFQLAGVVLLQLGKPITGRLGGNPKQRTEVGRTPEPSSPIQLSGNDRGNQQLGGKGICFILLRGLVAGMAATDMADLMRDRPTLACTSQNILIV